MPTKKKPPLKKISDRHIASQDNPSKTGKTSRNQGLQRTEPPQDLQQLVVNAYKNAFTIELDPSSNNIAQLVQQVKQHLFHRDFVSAFGTEDFRQAYALRWSPSRALAYLHIFCGLDLLGLNVRSEAEAEAGAEAECSSNARVGNGVALRESCEKGWKIVCVGGGGGAELVALAAYLRHGLTTAPEDRMQTRLDCHLVDIADWSSVTRRLLGSLTISAPASGYGSQDIRGVSQPLVDPACFSGQFLQADILSMDIDELTSTFQDAMLVTIMFTLNELYSTSMKATTQFLLNLTDVLRPGALLLVVDSPGSYSTVGIGSDKAKKYPMQWLLDHTLLESAAAAVADRGQRWEKQESCDSQWFRLKGLEYPIELEDMRYQLHLFRRV